MGDGEDGGTGVGNAAAVLAARGAEVLGNRKAGRHFETATAEAEEDLGPTSDPAGAGADGADDVVVEAGIDRGADAVPSGVKIARRDESQGPCAGEGSDRLRPGPGMMPEEGPSGGGIARSGFEPAIGQERDVVGGEHLDLVDEAFAGIQHAEVQAVRGLRSEAERVRDGEELPRGLGGLVGVRPARRTQRVRPGIDEFQRRTATVRPLAPASTVGIGDLGHDDADGGGGHLAHVVGRTDGVRLGEGDAFTAVGKGAGPVAKHGGGIDAGMVGEQAGAIGSDHDKSTGRNGRAGREGEVHAVLETPARKVHGGTGPVVELDELVGIVLRDRMVIEFVEDDLFDTPHTVGGARRPGCKPAPFRGSIRRPAGGDSVFLPAHADGIEDAAAIRTDQVHGFSGGTQAEAELGLVHREKAARREDRSGRKAVAVGAEVVGQHAASEVDLDTGAVVEFDEVEEGKIGVGEEFVEHDAIGGVSHDGIDIAGAAAAEGAGGIGARISLAVARVDEDQ